MADSEWANDWVIRQQWSKKEAIALLKGFNPEKIEQYKKYRPDELEYLLTLVFEDCCFSNAAKILELCESERKIEFPASPTTIIELARANDLWVPSVIEEAENRKSG